MMPSLNASPSKRKSSSSASSAFQRQCKAAYLSVQSDIESPLETKDQLLTALQQAGRNPSKKLIQKYWTAKTRKITFDEFCQILQKEPEANEQELLRAFQKVDKNGDDFISFKELKTILVQKGEELSSSEMHEIFDDADLNHDGKIDYKEFVSMVKNTKEQTKQATMSRLDRMEKSKRIEKAEKRLERTRQHRSGASLNSVEEDEDDDGVQANGEHDSPSTSGVKSKSSSKFTNEKVSSSNGFLQLPAPSQSFSSAPDLKKLKEWKIVKRKGVFFYDDDPVPYSVIGHRYTLTLNKSDTVWFTLGPVTSNDMPPVSSDRPPVDTVLFVLGTKLGCHVVASTRDRDAQGCYHVRCSLKAGDYILIPFTSGSRFRPRPADIRHKSTVDLLEKDKNGDSMRLTKQYRMALLNIFDLFDLDDNGGLNREEFNLFNMRTGDDEVTDEEWNVVQSQFDTKRGELTVKGFTQLHQMDAEDGEGDTEDMWVSLQAIGYNNGLQMDEAAPFVMQIFTEDSEPQIRVDGFYPLRHGEEWHAIGDYLLKSSDLLKADRLLKFHHYSCPFWTAILLKPETKDSKPYKNVKLEFEKKQNASPSSLERAVEEMIKFKLGVLWILPDRETLEWGFALKT